MEVGIYGLGRFGYFWAELLSGFFTVKAYSRNPKRLTPENVERVTEEKLLDCKAIFLCNAISSFEEVIKRISSIIYFILSSRVLKRLVLTGRHQQNIQTAFSNFRTDFHLMKI